MSALVPVTGGQGGPPVRPGATLAELIAPFLGWLATIRGRSRNTILGYEKDLRRFAAFAESIGVRTPPHVTFNVVEMYLAHRLHLEGRKATTLNRARYAIGQFFRFLRRQGLATSDPVADTFSLKEPQRLPSYLSIADQERVLVHFAASASLEGRRDYAVVATALFCGLRVSELATLRLADVDLEAGVLRVTGKGDTERECPIIPRLAAILRDYVQTIRPQLMALPVRGSLKRKGRLWSTVIELKGSSTQQATGTTDETEARAILADRVADLRIRQTGPFLFVRAHPHGAHVYRKAGRPLLTRSLFMLVRRRLTPVVGRPVAPHMLRHSFASRLRENGAPLELIQEALGHANISTTLIYAHLSSSKRREDLARFLEGDGRSTT